MPTVAVATARPGLAAQSKLLLTREYAHARIMKLHAEIKALASRPAHDEGGGPVLAGARKREAPEPPASPTSSTASSHASGPDDGAPGLGALRAFADVLRPPPPEAKRPRSSVFLGQLVWSERTQTLNPTAEAEAEVAREILLQHRPEMEGCSSLDLDLRENSLLNDAELAGHLAASPLEGAL